MMRNLATAIVMTALGVAIGSAQTPPRTFDEDRVGAAPDGFAFAASRQATAGNWFVRREGTTGVMTHAADPAAHGYSLALSSTDLLADVTVNARLKLAGGARAGGVIWRYQDPDNFYAALLDLSQGTLAMYLFRNGNRITIEAEDDLELDPGAWHTIRVEHDRTYVAVAIGGIRVFDERDSRLERTLGPGRSGVVATGDSEIWVDHLRIEPSKPRR